MEKFMYEKLKVLLIEDTPSDLKLAREVVKNSGINNIDIATNLAEVQIISSEDRNYDLIISDTMYGRHLLLGPPSVRLLRRANKPVVVAVSSDVSCERHWPKGFYDYFFTKSEFYINGCLEKVLQERFKS